MKKHIVTSLLLMQTALAVPLMAQVPPPDPAPTTETEHFAPLDLKITGLADGKPIPAKYAYCMPDGKGKTKDAGNISPAFNWMNAPAETQSFVFIVVDKDVPASFESANQDGQEIAVDFPRQDFYHWVLADIPATTFGLYEGADSKAITKDGKPVGKRPYGINGKNDYSKVYPGPNNTNSWGGYDGPCPPWNDLRLHHYHFILYALDIPTLGLPNPITGPQAKAAMEGHVLAKGEVVGVYSNHPRWLAEFGKQGK